jgi:hypothetical protein
MILKSVINSCIAPQWVPPPASNKAEDKPGVDPPKPQTLPPLPVPKPKPHVDHSELPLDWCSLGQWGMVSTQIRIRSLWEINTYLVCGR